jgi:hypothetical protein
VTFFNKHLNQNWFFMHLNIFISFF